MMREQGEMQRGRTRYLKAMMRNLILVTMRSCCTVLKQVVTWYDLHFRKITVSLWVEQTISEQESSKKKTDRKLF